MLITGQQFIGAKIYTIVDMLYRAGAIVVRLGVGNRGIVYKQYVLITGTLFETIHTAPIIEGTKYIWRGDGWYCWIENGKTTSWIPCEIQPLTYYPRYLSSISNISADLPLYGGIIVDNSNINISKLKYYLQQN